MHFYSSLLLFLSCTVDGYRSKNSVALESVSVSPSGEIEVTLPQFGRAPSNNETSMLTYDEEQVARDFDGNEATRAMIALTLASVAFFHLPVYQGHGGGHVRDCIGQKPHTHLNLPHDVEVQVVAEISAQAAGFSVGVAIYRVYYGSKDLWDIIVAFPGTAGSQANSSHKFGQLWQQLRSYFKDRRPLLEYFSYDESDGSVIPHYSGLVFQATVMGYYKDALDILWPDIWPVIVEECENRGPDRFGDVVFAGFSLGGALSALAAVRWGHEVSAGKNRGNREGDRPHFGIFAEKLPMLYTFGSPRLGNWAFAELVESLTYPWRIVNRADVIPTFPFCRGGFCCGSECCGAVGGFLGVGSCCQKTCNSRCPEDANHRHYGPVIHFPDGMAEGSRIVQCRDGEDERCKDVLRSSVHDHEYYYGHKVGRICFNAAKQFFVVWIFNTHDIDNEGIELNGAHKKLNGAWELPGDSFKAEFQSVFGAQPVLLDALGAESDFWTNSDSGTREAVESQLAFGQQRGEIVGSIKFFNTAAEAFRGFAHGPYGGHNNGWIHEPLQFRFHGQTNNVDEVDFAISQVKVAFDEAPMMVPLPSEAMYPVQDVQPRNNSTIARCCCQD